MRNRAEKNEWRRNTETFQLSCPVLCGLFGRMVRVDLVWLACSWRRQGSYGLACGFDIIDTGTMEGMNSHA
jgi:hypothetical protein